MTTPPGPPAGSGWSDPSGPGEPAPPGPWDDYAYGQLGPDLWSGAAPQAWGPPPWSAAPAMRSADRRRTGTRLGIIAFCMPLVAIPIGLLGLVTLLAGIGILFLTVAVLLWLGCVPLAVASLVVLWRSGRQPFWPWLVRCLPGIAVICTVGASLVLSNVQHVTAR